MRPISFANFCVKATHLYSTGKHARKTRLRVEQVLRELAALGVKSTADLTTATMAVYVKSKGSEANPNTVNGLLSAIASVTSYAVEEGWLEREPAWSRIRLRPTPMVLNAPRSYAEVSRLLSHLHRRRNRSWEDGRLCALAWTVAYLGVRLGEAVHAELDDLSPTEFHVNAARHRLKTVPSDRRIPLPRKLRPVLREWVPRTGPWIFPGVRRMGPWTGGTTGSTRALDALKSAALDVGVESITWHSLRHSFGTTAVQRWEMPLWTVQRIMGHTDIRTTQRYLHLDGAPEIAQAIEGASYNGR